MTSAEISTDSCPAAPVERPRRGSRRAPPFVRALALGLLLFPLRATSLSGQKPTEPSSPKACLAIASDAERLACYDRALGRDSERTTALPAPDPAAVDADAPASPAVELEPRSEPSSATLSLLDSRWELFPESKLGTFNLRAYQPIYVLPWVHADEVDQFPSSPAPDHTVDDSESLGRSELKFQLSWKTKAWQGVFGERGDLWIGYTQSSRWQVYNSKESRPFRETDYEPELLLVFATDYRLAGWSGRLASVGLNHQSNGRDEPRSRSWNRITASVAFERPGWTLTLRPWWRVPERDKADDNPDIEEYLGRGDLLLVRHVRNHELTAQLRHTFRGGERSRGAAQVDWAFPLYRNLRGHVQLFHGYGESLIDYNFRTTRIGLGLSLIEWY